MTLASQYTNQLVARLPKLSASQRNLEILMTTITAIIGTDGIEGMAPVAIIPATKAEALEELKATHEISLDQIETAASELTDIVFAIIDELAAEFKDLTGYQVDGTNTGFKQAFEGEQAEHQQNVTFANQVKTEIAEVMTKLNLGDTTSLEPKPVAITKAKINPKQAVKDGAAKLASFFAEPIKQTDEEEVIETPGWKTAAIISPNAPEYKKFGIVLRVLKAGGDIVTLKAMLAEKKLSDAELLPLLAKLWKLANDQIALSEVILKVAKEDFERFQASTTGTKIVVGALDKCTKFFSIKL